MRTFATGAVVLALAALGAAPQQESNFESQDFGIKLSIPAGWTIDSSRQARVILKLTRPSDSVVKPELLVYEGISNEPITVGQYKEQLRHLVQRVFKEPRVLDDRTATAAGRPGFILVVASKGTGDLDVVSYKGIFELSPRRLLGVDGVFPKGQEEALEKTYVALIESLGTIPKRPVPGLEEGSRQLAQALDKIVADPAPTHPKEELEIVSGEKKLGTYTVSAAPATREGKAGLETEAVLKLDLGDDGRVETSIKGFLANDLTYQAVQSEELKVGKDKRAQSFSAQVVLSKGEVSSERRINGEKVSARIKVADRTVLGELAEPLLFRLLPAGKTLVGAPSIGAFDNEPGVLKIELRGLSKMKVDETTADVHVAFLARDDGNVATYLYDGEKRLMRITQGNQSLVIRRKK